jgi:hypothetical protein
MSHVRARCILYIFDSFLGDVGDGATSTQEQETCVMKQYIISTRARSTKNERVDPPCLSPEFYDTTSV